MGLTLKEWDEKFSEMSREDLVKSVEALDTLKESAPAIYEEFKWTCLWALKIGMEATIVQKDRE